MPHAEHIRIGCMPSPSVPAETLVQDGWLTFLLFFAVSEEVGSSGYLADLGVAVAECIGCSSAKMGYPNDEGLPEHPLYSAGISDGMGVYRLSSSPWLADVESQMRRSRDRIGGLRGIGVSDEQGPLFHFIMPLKEATFECLAGDIQVRGYHRDFDDAFKYVRSRFAEH